MSYDCTKTACCQEKYILGELLVRTDWQVVGGARVASSSVTSGAAKKSKRPRLKGTSMRHAPKKP